MKEKVIKVTFPASILKCLSTARNTANKNFASIWSPLIRGGRSSATKETLI